jgi:hypothetical protein
LYQVPNGTGPEKLSMYQSQTFASKKKLSIHAMCKYD